MMTTAVLDKDDADEADRPRRGRPPGPASKPNTDSPLFAGKFMTLEKVAADLGKSPRSMRRFVLVEGLPTMKIGGTTYVEVEAFQAWLSSRRRGGVAEPKRRRR